jgi:hypothetical protein
MRNLWDMERLLGRKRTKVISILKERKDSEMKLVGVWIPLQVHAYIMLHTLAKGTNRTNVLRELVNAWIEDRVKNHSETEKVLIQEVIQRIWTRWIIQRASGRRRMTFIKFMELLSQELKKTGIPENYIEKIKVGVNQCYAKDKEEREGAE